MLWYIGAILVGYLVGSINLSIFLCKKLKGEDIRNLGSGNAGTTNTLRVLGKGPAIIVLAFDILKGVIVVLIAKALMGISSIPDPRLLVQLAAFAVVIGHNFPIYFRFKGGKGVATSLGVILTMNWKIGLICLIFALIIMAISRYVSLGSVLGAVLYPVVTIVLEPKDIIFALALAMLVLVRHSTNVRRLIQGKENKLSFKTK